jgi:phosphoglycolate phosphatase
MIKLLIFDLDGTLVDSLKDISSATNRLLQQEGLAPLSEDKVRFHIGEGLRRLLGDLLPNYRPDHPEFRRIESDFMRYYIEECTRSVQWMPKIQNFLTQWRGPKALVTNKNWAPTKLILDHLAIQPQDWVFLAGVDSWPQRKPHPGPLIEAMRRAGVSPRETLMIGDGKPDLRAAHAAGTLAAAVSFGYTDPGELLALRPDALINSYEELGPLIAHLNQNPSPSKL